jgi:hypothetical protein
MNHSALLDATFFAQKVAHSEDFGLKIIIDVGVRT